MAARPTAEALAAALECSPMDRLSAALGEVNPLDNSVSILCRSVLHTFPSTAAGTQASSGNTWKYLLIASQAPP